MKTILALNSTLQAFSSAALPEEPLLVPAGQFAGRDGRDWSNPNPQLFIKAAQDFGLDIAIDIEHSTELKGPKGDPAPAMAWIAIADLIHCTPFADRVAHHALVRFMEPTFERVLLPQVYACREGKGIHRAVQYAQQQARRYPWVMHVDIAQYFPNIRHGILWQQLRRRFRGDGMHLVQAVIDSYANIASQGLPIGSLTSQHFANHYLNEADRWLLAQANVEAMCRYMDDYLIWADSKQALVKLQYALSAFLQAVLGLTAKPALIQASAHGIFFAAFALNLSALSLRYGVNDGINRRCWNGMHDG